MIDLPAVYVNDICKSFASDRGDGALRVLDSIHFSVRPSEIVCIVGHSGCGKTTLLRIICGFEKADSGAVLIDGVKKEKPSKDTIMIFQAFDQLLPWKTLLGNVMFPLLETKAVKTKEEARHRAQRLLRDVGLGDFMNSYPSHVSGGMKQRTAVARALAMRPRVLLMDEPFAALDAITRRDVQDITMDVCRKNGVSVLFVTHSIPEAFIMADKIVVLASNPGRVLEIVNNSDKDSIDETGKKRRSDHVLEYLDAGH